MSKFIWVFHFDKFCPEFIIDAEQDAYLQETLFDTDYDIVPKNFIIFTDIDDSKIRIDMRAVKFTERIITKDFDYEDD